MDYSVKIGLVSCRRDVTPRPGIFNWEKAEQRGRAMVEYIMANFTTPLDTFVDVKGVNPVDVMINENDAEWIAERFLTEKVDALFVVNANFGNAFNR